MDNNNDFYQKFDYSQKSHGSNKAVLTTIFTSFISAVVGAICAVFIYSSIVSTNNPESINTGATTSNTSSQVNIWIYLRFP